MSLSPLDSAPTAVPAAPPRYAAFISYSHKDSHHAAWLHRTLESYRLPKDLTFQSRLERDRLYPVFRDEEELAAAPDLSEKIMEALSASDALIVVCSAAAAASKWVNKEIEYFCSIGRSDRVFGVLVDGDPTTSFPPALKAVPELFAPDTREKKHRRTAALKLIAGMHGLTLGQVIERDRIRRRNTMVQLALGGVAGAALFGILGVSWWSASRLAVAERRDRLLTETRAAFEDDKPEIALTTLAEAWPLLGAEDQKTYAPVVAAWVPRFQSLDSMLASLPESGIVRDSNGAFLHEKHGLVRLPFAKGDLIAFDAATRAATALTRTGELFQSPAPDTPPTLAAQSARWPPYVWRETIALRNGSVLFAGNINADKLSEQLPMLLVVSARARRWSLIGVQDDFFGAAETAGLFLSPDCKTIAWAGTEIAEQEGAGTSYRWSSSRRVYRMELDTARAQTEEVDLAAVSGFSEARPTRDTNYLSTFAGRCSDGPVDTVAAPALALPRTPPQAPESEAKRRARDAKAYEEDATRQKARSERFGALATAIQRGKFVLKGGLPTDAELIGSDFPGSRLSADFRRNYAAVAYATASQTPGGYDHREYTNVCVHAQGTGVACTRLDFHRAPGKPRFYDGFVYVAGGEVPDDPLFVLVRLPQLETIAVRDRALSGAMGADGRATALSPSRGQLALVDRGELLLFRLSPEQRPRLAARHRVPSLADSAAAAVTFAGEQSLLIARSDGLLMRFDLDTGRELWRLRLPSADTRLLAIDAGELIVVRTGEKAFIIDAKAGLPLTERMRVFDFQPPAGAAQRECPTSFFLGQCFDPTPKVLDPECTKRPSAARCFDGEEYARLLRAAAPSADDWARTDRDGAVIVADGGSWDRPPSAKALPTAWITHVRCSTGWRVQAGTVRRFDPLEIVQVEPVSAAKVLERCAGELE